MCGRYQFTAEQCEEIRQIADAIQRKYGSDAWSPGEIRPSNRAPVLLGDAGSPVPKLMKWGYQLPGHQCPGRDGAREAPVSGQRPKPALSDPIHGILRVGQPEAEVPVYPSPGGRPLYGGTV